MTRHPLLHMFDPASTTSTLDTGWLRMNPANYSAKTELLIAGRCWAVVLRLCSSAQISDTVTASNNVRIFGIAISSDLTLDS